MYVEKYLLDHYRFYIIYPNHVSFFEGNIPNNAALFGSQLYTYSSHEAQKVPENTTESKNSHGQVFFVIGV